MRKLWNDYIIGSTIKGVGFICGVILAITALCKDQVTFHDTRQVDYGPEFERKAYIIAGRLADIWTKFCI